MQGRTISSILAAATIVMMALFTGYDLAGRGQAVQVEEPPGIQETEKATEPTRPPEPQIQTAPPETEPDEEELLRLACGSAAETMDGEHIFVYDPAAYRMVYCGTDPLEAMYPASITKLYTAYLALMYLEPETVVTAGDELKLVQPGSSTAYIARGHRLTVEMLIEAMLLPSGNDAAYVLAAAAGRAIAGDDRLAAEAAVEAFIGEMNREAFRLGLLNTQFANPDGYHDEYHYSCPQDVAVFSSVALADPVIAKYTRMCADAVTFKSGQVITWYNTNLLVNPDSKWYSPHAVGAKTGYTTEAGYCLLAAFREGEREIIVGVFGSGDKHARYHDAVTLWDLCR